MLKGCLEKFVGLIRSLHGGVKARVSFSGALSDEIPVDNRVKQGDISAPTLFTIYFAVVFFLFAFYEKPDGIYIRYRTSSQVYNIRRLLGHTKFSFLVRELLYADNCAIVTHSENEMQRFMNSFAHEYSLEINLKKTLMHDQLPGLPYIKPIMYVEGKKTRRGTLFCISWQDACWEM